MTFRYILDTFEKLVLFPGLDVTHRGQMAMRYKRVTLFSFIYLFIHSAKRYLVPNISLTAPLRIELYCTI